MQKRIMFARMFNESLAVIVLRFTVYTLIIFGFTTSLPVIIKQDTGFFQENGPLEWAQLGLLIAGSMVFIAGPYVAPAFRQLFRVLACLPAFAAVRELDALLDEMIPLTGWKIGFVLIAYAGYFAYVNWDMLREQIRQFISGRAFAVLWAGFVLAIPFAQLVGHGPFLQLVMGDDYVYGYKQIIEETGEFVGYFLILVGSVEALVQTRCRTSCTPQPITHKGHPSLGSI